MVQFQAGRSVSITSEFYPCTLTAHKQVIETNET